QVATTTHPTQSTGFFTNAYNAVVSGASNLWDRVTGGSKSNSNQTLNNNHIPGQTGGLTEYPNGARTPIPFKEGIDGVFSEPRKNQLHGAVDLMTPEKTPVVAVADGKVSLLHNEPDNFLRNSDPNKVNKNDRGGATISIEHTNAKGEKVYTYYAHNSELLVKPDQIVKKGDLISLSGQSGNTPGGPHIHFTIYKPTNGKLKETDPMLFDWNKFEDKN
ncbi:M23 family metallopeptidase, partial [Leptospira weilii]|uniref:M23 family metallopeptidase n=1 Tax=Leptospira weilii TaxID=28184 RepID=UPI000B0C434E